MNVEALIAAKKAERVAKGFSMRITFENRPDFNAYYASKSELDRNLALAVASIGKRGRDGSVASTVTVL